MKAAVASANGTEIHRVPQPAFQPVFQRDRSAVAFGGWNGAIDTARPEIIDAATGPRPASKTQ